MYRFIVVDDEHLIRKGILKKIEGLSLDLQFVGEADNGEDALELINKVNPDIVLTDMRMPLMDGKMLLRKLHQDFPHIKTIVISGYSDFEYLQEAISSQASDYILKPFNREEIHKALKRAINSIEKELSTRSKMESIAAENEQASYNIDLKYLSDLIVNQQANYDSGYLKSKSTSFIKDCGYYIVVSIYAPEKPSEDLYFNLLKYTKLPESFLFTPGPANQNICFLLCTFNEVNKLLTIRSIKEEVSRISEYLKSIEVTNFYMSISSVISDLSGFHTAYLQTISTFEKRDLYSNEKIFYHDENVVHPSDLNWNSNDKLIFFIEAGNVIKVRELLNNFFSELNQFSPLNLISVKFNCQLIFNRVIDMLQGYYEVFNNYSFSNKYERMMRNTFDLGTIKQAFEQLIVSIALLLKEKHVYPSDEIIGNIKKYIQKNYSQEITLEKMSELFFINPSYCSHLFKEKTGENFADYINDVRINKAKDLLLNTDYKVYKIAKMLGYDNDKYFFRIFKKLTGSTPEGFRETFSKTKIN
jgi:two-component system, response regulator YesN